MTSSKDSKTLIIDPKDMKMYKLSDKEFRIILLKKFGKLQEKKLSKIRNNA